MCFVLRLAVLRTAGALLQSLRLYGDSKWPRGMVFMRRTRYLIGSLSSDDDDAEHDAW